MVVQFDLWGTPERNAADGNAGENGAELLIEETGARTIRETVLADEIEAPLLFDKLPKYKTAKSAQQFIRLALMNPVNATILERLPKLGLSDVWLTSGCLFQSVWNVLSGKTATDGIKDYDVFYYDDDTSWEAEDRVIHAGEELFSDLDCHVEIRNQARVHLWYEGKFGIPYRPLKYAHHAIRRFPSRASAVAITKLPDGRIAFYAPFGFKELFRMEVKPNHRLPIGEVYELKTSRWVSNWPKLKVAPWEAVSTAK